MQNMGGSIFEITNTNKKYLTVFQIHVFEILANTVDDAEIVIEPPHRKILYCYTEYQPEKFYSNGARG